MPKDLILTKNDLTNEFELTPINVKSDLGKTFVSASVTAVQWTAWWAGAFLTNVGVCALPGALIGVLAGFGHAQWNEPCIKEKNSIAVNKCAWSSSDTIMGTLYGASAIALIGAAVTTIGFFKSPTIKGAKATMAYTAVGATYCCATICKSFSNV